MDDKIMLTTFLDMVGRTIIGEKITETDEVLTIKNPVVIHVTPQPDPQGNVRMALQLFPLFFREFLVDKSEAIEWDFLKANITIPKKQPMFDFKLGIQYRQLFIDTPAPVQVQAPAQVPTPNKPSNVIKLFDD